MMALNSYAISLEVALVIRNLGLCTSWYLKGLGSDTGSTWMFTGSSFNKGMLCMLHVSYRLTTFEV